MPIMGIIPVQYVLLSAILLITFAPKLSFCDQLIQYEPAVVELSGTVKQAKFQHPNGQWVPFSLLKLKVPVSVKADPENEINTDEKGVSEIQLYTDSENIRRTLKAKAGKSVIVKGTVFHEHTAWHVRPLVMSVTQVR